MPYQVRMIEDLDDVAPQIGDMFYVTPERVKAVTDPSGKTRYFCYGHQLSDEYVAERMSKRRPLVVVLPSRSGRGAWLCVDCAYDGSDHGWQVTGEPPNITVHPSINLGAIYHGWLQNGVISDG